MKRYYVITIIIVLLGILVGCSSNDKTANWDTFVEQFIEGYFELYPNIGINAGRHEFDGQLPDWSAEGLSAQVDFRNQAIEDAKAFNETNLSEFEKYERMLNTHLSKNGL